MPYTHMLCADGLENIGRCDIDSFAQQTLFELLVSGFEDQSLFLDMEGDYTDINEWAGLEFDSKNDCTKISWFMLRLGGMIDLRYIPPSVTVFTVTFMGLHGSINLQSLSEVHDFSAYSNRLSGSICLSDISAPIVSLELGKNSFSGSVNLTGLPSTLEKLSLWANNVSGSIDLSRLPASLKILGLNDNSVSGSIDLKHLPEGLCGLHLYSNMINGLVDATKLPESLKTVNLGKNNVEVLIKPRKLRNDIHFYIANNPQVEIREM